MRRYSDRNPLHTLAELNVTPLLDLAFVLLIIFIITTPLMDNKTDIVLPSSRASDNAVNPNAVQTVAIHRDDTITLNNEPAELDHLSEVLGKLKETHADLAVVIRSDKDLPVQKLINVMDAIKKAEISKIGVVTSPETQ